MPTAPAASEATATDTAPGRLFRFVQFEFPWALGPPAGRYVVRDEGGVDATHILVIATLGAAERRRLRPRRSRPATPEPDAAPVTTGRATVIDAGPVAEAEAARWLAEADGAVADAALVQLARAVHSYRLAAADPAVPEPARTLALVARAGYGAGEDVADGRWTAARELAAPRDGRRTRRTAVLRPQERLAALLGGRATMLMCEELALRARHDLDRGRERTAALQLRAALDAALAELPETAVAFELSDRIEELRAHRTPVAAAAESALTAPLSPTNREAVASALQRLEAALRAHALAEANPQLEG